MVLDRALIQNADARVQAWADARFLRDERADQARAELARLRRERRALVARRRRLLARLQREAA